MTIGQLSIDRVTRIVAMYLSPPHDVESIAMNILLESWANGVELPTTRFIRLKCYTALRKHHREIQVSEFASNPEKDFNLEQLRLHNQDELNLLFRVLTQLERKVIFLKYYEDLSNEDIAKMLKKSNYLVSETLTVALYKMRNAM